MPNVTLYDSAGNAVTVEQGSAEQAAMVLQQGFTYNPPANPVVNNKPTPGLVVSVGTNPTPEQMKAATEVVAAAGFDVGIPVAQTPTLEEALKVAKDEGIGVQGSTINNEVVPTIEATKISTEPAPASSVKNKGSIESLEEAGLVVNVGRPSTASEIVASNGAGLPEEVLEQAKEAVKSGEGDSPQVAIEYLELKTGQPSTLAPVIIVSEMGEEKAAKYLEKAGVENAKVVASQAAEVVNSTKVIIETLDINKPQYQALSLSPADVSKLVSKLGENTTTGLLNKVGFNAKDMITGAKKFDAQQALFKSYSQKNYLQQVNNPDGSITYTIDLMALVGDGLTEAEIQKAVSDLNKLGFAGSSNATGEQKAILDLKRLDFWGKSISDIEIQIRDVNEFVTTHVKVGGGENQWMLKSDFDKLSDKDQKSMLSIGMTASNKKWLDYETTLVTGKDANYDSIERNLTTARDAGVITESQYNSILSDMEKSKNYEIPGKKWTKPSQQASHFWNSLPQDLQEQVLLASAQRPHGMEVVKETGTILAGMIPVVGTIVNWNQMSTGWKIASIVLDLVAVGGMAAGKLGSAARLVGKNSEIAKLVDVAKEAGSARSELRTALSAMQNAEREATISKEMEVLLKTNLEIAANKSAAVDTRLAEYFRNASELTKSDLRLIEDASGFKGLTKATLQVTKVQEKLEAAWNSLDKLSPGTEAYIKKLTKIQELHNSLDKAYEELGITLNVKGKPGIEPEVFKGYEPRWKLDTNKNLWNQFEDYFRSKDKSDFDSGSGSGKGKSKVAVATKVHPKMEKLDLDVELKAKFEEKPAETASLEKKAPRVKADTSKFSLSPRPSVPSESYRYDTKKKESHTQQTTRAIGIPLKSVAVPVRTEITPDKTVSTPEIIKQAAEDAANIPGQSVSIITETATVISAAAATEAIANGASQEEVHAVTQAVAQSVVQQIADTITKINAEVGSQISGQIKSIVNATVENVVKLETRKALQTKTKTLTLVKTKVGLRNVNKQKSSIGLIIPTQDKEKNKKAVYPVHPEGTIAFRTGKLHNTPWHILEPPYNQAHYTMEISDTPPEGAIVTTSDKVAETIQLLGGKLDKDLNIDIGAFDYHIKKAKSGQKPSSYFTRDIKSKTKHELSAKEARVIVSSVR